MKVAMDLLKFKGKRKAAGMPPGSVIFTGRKKVEEIKVHFLVYDNTDLDEKVFTTKEFSDVDEVTKNKVDWYDTRGLHDTKFIEQLGQKFELHNLILEDVVDAHQRPKYDEYDNGIFIIFKALHFDKSQLKVTREQVAVFFRPDLILSFQEDETDLFSAVRSRLKAHSGRIRSRGADYLCYALIDNVVDQYFIVLDQMGDAIQEIEQKMMEEPTNEIRSDIHRMKKQIILVRKSISPLREAIGQFSRSENDHIDKSTSIFIRDLYDHTIQIMEMVESYRDVLNGLQDLYISEISLRMNQVMQILTIITTIFVPLSFLVGLYGMNFEYMPELGYRYAYFVLLGVMFLIFMGALWYFRRKKWL